MVPMNVVMLCFLWLSSWPMASGGRLNLTVLHTNDVHARFDEANAFGGRCPPQEAEEGKCFGGVARIKTKVDEIRKEDNNTLFLNAGDYYQGTLYFTLFKYNITSFFTNKLEYDAVSLGNHEFDLGVEGLVPYIDKADHPVMACNLNLSQEPDLQGKVDCFKIFPFGDEKVAVVGFVTPDTKDLSQPGKVIFLDEVEVLQRVVNDLTKSGVDKIIALGHSGYNVDLDIAKRVKGLDVVVGGHTNTFLYTGTPPTKNETAAGEYPTVVLQEDGSKVLVVQAYAYGKYLGYLNVQFDEHGKVDSWSGNPILLNSSVEMDNETQQALLPYKEAVKMEGSAVVGQTHVLLYGEQRRCRLQECNMGNLIADASVRFYARAPTNGSWTKQSICIFNSGGIRASIDEELNHGNITMEDVLTVFPFGNTADLASLYGKHLRQAMEMSVQNYNLQSPKGAFLQVSGLKVTYDLSKPPGKRVVDLKALCNHCRVPKYLDVQNDQLYQMVLPSYVLEGGDGYHVIRDNAVNIYKTGDLDVDVLLHEIKRSSPLTTSEEKRITFLETSPCNCNFGSRLSPTIFLLGCILIFSLC